jgi:hypothetical protein
LPLPIWASVVQWFGEPAHIRQQPLGPLGDLRLLQMIDQLR